MQPKSPWWVVAGLSLVLAVSSGFGFYNLSVYMNALAAERSFAVASLSAAVALLFVAGGVAGIVVGRLIERYDVRAIMVVGAVIGGLALALIGSVREMWQAYALFALFGAGNGGVSLVPATTVITRWFPGANRSFAMSVASTGLSVGGVLLTPLSADLVHRLGAPAATPWFGAAYVAVIVPTALLLVQSWPPSRRPAPMQGEGAGDALRTRFFQGIVVTYVLVMASQVGGIAHVFNHVENGAGHLVASATVSALAASSIVGRLCGGVILTAGFPIRVFTLVNIAGQALGLILLGGGEEPALLLAGAVAFGLTIGNLLMLQPLLLVQAFGSARYTRIYPLANAASTVGLASGPLLMGLVHDAANYAWAFGASAAASALALVAFLAAGRLPAAPGQPH